MEDKIAIPLRSVLLPPCGARKALAGDIVLHFLWLLEDVQTNPSGLLNVFVMQIPERILLGLDTVVLHPKPTFILVHTIRTESQGVIWGWVETLRARFIKNSIISAKFTIRHISLNKFGTFWSDLKSETKVYVCIDFGFNLHHLLVFKMNEYFGMLGDHAYLQ